MVGYVIFSWKITPFLLSRQVPYISLWRFLPNLANLKDEADSILVDLWFGAFEVPVDDIRSFTWDEMHPPLPPLPLDPFFPTWVWGLISSASSAVVMLIPLYCCLLEADNHPVDGSEIPNK